MVLYIELEENLGVMVGRLFLNMQKKDLRVNLDKSKLRILGGEEGLVCAVQMKVSWSNSRSLSTWGLC